MRRLAGSALLLVFLLVGCHERSAPAPQAETPAAPSATQPAPAASQVTPATVEPAPAPKPTAAPGGTQAPAPKVTAVPASDPKPVVAPAPGPAPVPVPASKPSPAPMATPTAVPAAAPAGPMPSLANNGHAAVGADKCRMCHRIQHDSWSATAHAKKGLDCEGCHGNGADYKAMPVMKNPAAAKAAGLVMPGPDFCRKCHGAKADAALLSRAHAHKG